MATYGIIGQRTPRTDGVDKVRGASVYTADVHLDGMLWGKILRSPYPHGRILRVDASRARDIPGVFAVVTAQDIPDALVGMIVRDMPVLARDKVRYAGEAVAAVAAEDADAAEEALAAIEVEYEELPAVFDEVEGVRDGAPLVHDDPSVYGMPPRPGAGTPQFFRYAGTPLPLDGRPNVNAHLYWGKGDVDAGFAQADRIFEHTFTTKRVHQGYLEPHACLVWIDSDRLVQVRASQKAPFSLRRQLADATLLDPERIVVEPMMIGGDFGGKASLMNVALAYFLAERAARPVKIVMSYAEEFMAGNPRHPARVTLRTGVTKEGVMTATHAFVHLNSGAYVARSGGRGLPLVSDAAGVYRTPNVRIDCLAVYTNTLPHGHFRGVGQPPDGLRLRVAHGHHRP